MTTRILVAQEKNSINVLVSALSGYDVLPVTGLLESQRLLIEDGIDLFVIGVHFDDSQALDLVKFIRADSKHKKTPIVIVRYRASDHAVILRQSIEVMIAVDAVSAYIEKRSDDDESFGELVRAAVEKHLPAKKRLSAAKLKQR